MSARMLSAFAASCLAVGCGAPRVPAAGSDPESRTLPSAPQPEAVTAEQRAAFAPVLRHTTEKKLYVWPLDSLLLFADERLEAQQIIADWAAEVGFQLVSPPSSEAAIAAAAAGKNPSTGAACGPALPRSLAVARWLPELGADGHLRATVYCDPDCAIQFEIQLDRLGTEFFAAPFDVGKPWRAELATRLRELRDNGGHGQHGHLNNPVLVKGIARASSVDAELFPDDGDQSVATVDEIAAAKACGADLDGVRVLVEGRAGQPFRCERLETSRYSNDFRPAVNTCFCQALAKAGARTGHRRVLVAPPTRELAGQQETASGRRLSASILTRGQYSDEPWTERWFFANCDGSQNCDDIGHCFLKRTELLPSTNISATIEFDGDGRATKAVIADLAGVLSAPERECVSAKLLTGQIPCPQAAGAVRTGRIDLSISEAQP